MRKASPVLLEPMMAVEVETPEDYAGLGDGRPVVPPRHGAGMDDMPGGGKAIKARSRCRDVRLLDHAALDVAGSRHLRWNSSTTPGAEERRRRHHHGAGAVNISFGLIGPAVRSRQDDAPET